MTELDRLREIIETLPPEQVHALLMLLDPGPVTDEEFSRRLSEAPEEEVDEETAARILAAMAEPGTATHDEVKRRLGL